VVRRPLIATPPIARLTPRRIANSCMIEEYCQPTQQTTVAILVTESRTRRASNISRIRAARMKGRFISVNLGGSPPQERGTARRVAVCRVSATFTCQGSPLRISCPSYSGSSSSRRCSIIVRLRSLTCRECSRPATEHQPWHQVIWRRSSQCHP